MITAEEARRLAKVPDAAVVEQALAVADRMIRAAAERRERGVIIREGVWADSTEPQPLEWLAACETLRNLGYEVKPYYVERQLVDMGTEVRW